MKTIRLQLMSLFAIAFILFSSCEKEYPYPSKDYPTEVPSLSTGPTIDRWGVFLVIDATLYSKNLSTGIITAYRHFGSNKSRSSLR